MSAGVPHLDPSVFVPQIFWLIVCFAVFFLCMSFIFVPALRHILGRRADILHQDVQAAKRLKDDLLRQQILCAEKVEVARKQAASLVGAAADTARENNLLSQQRISKDLLIQFQKAQDDISVSIAELKNDVGFLSGQVYSLITEKIKLS